MPNMFNHRLPFIIFIRMLNASSVNNAAVNKTFRKVMGAQATKKRKLQFQEFPIIPKFNEFTKDIGEGKKDTTPKRANMLNKMFMRHITDLIVNGVHWEEYSRLGIEITRIQISTNYKQLNIYWISNKNINEDEVSDFLDENAFTLRHNLSQLRVMGAVPPIVFVKDKQQFQIMELDKRLAIADYGEDYEPSSIDRIKHKLEVYSPEDDVKAQLQQIEEDESSKSNQLPEMPQNVLGLDHAEIMNRLLKAKGSSKLRHHVTNPRHIDISPTQSDSISSREAFKLFLQKRQLISQRMNKEKKNYSPDMEYIKQELMNKSSKDHYDNIEYNLDSFDDFIEDDSK